METYPSESFSTFIYKWLMLRYFQVFLVILFWLWRIVRGNSGPPRVLWLTKVNRAIRSMVHLRAFSSPWHVMTNSDVVERFTPWQIIVSTLTAVYSIRNFDKILGLSGECKSTFCNPELPEHGVSSRAACPTGSFPLIHIYNETDTVTVFTIILSCNLDRHRVRCRIRHSHVNSAQVATRPGIHRILLLLHLVRTRS